MLPNIRFWVDDAHVRLVCSSINKGTVIHLKERIACIVLFKDLSTLHLLITEIPLTGECWPVVALLAKGITNSCPSTAAYIFISN